MDWVFWLLFNNIDKNCFIFVQQPFFDIFASRFDVILLSDME